MTDFETHPAGTADLVKRLRHKTQHRSSEDTCAAYFKRWERLDNPDGPEAANRIEQLVATVEQLEAELTRANAATAAAYEVAAREVECGCGAGPCQDTANCAAKDAAAIRALATPDQTAALDKLIAEAVDAALKQAAFWVEEAMVIVAPDGVPQRMALDSYRKQFSTLVLASKKGGV